MSITRLYQFGDYVYAPDGRYGVFVTDVTLPMGARLRAVETPGADDQYTGPSLAAPVKFSLSGRLKGADPDDLEDRWDAFRAAHAYGARRRFTRRADRYRMAQMEAITKAALTGQNASWLDFDVMFSAAPYEEAADAATVGLSAGANALTPGGTAPSPPVFTLVVSAVSAGGAVTLTSGDASRSLTFYPLTADTFTVDGAAQRVTGSSGNDATATLDGRFFALLPTDSVSLSVAGTITVAASVTTRARWY